MSMRSRAPPRRAGSLSRSRRVGSPRTGRRLAKGDATLAMFQGALGDASGTLDASTAAESTWKADDSFDMSRAFGGTTVDESFDRSYAAGSVYGTIPSGVTAATATDLGTGGSPGAGQGGLGGGAGLGASGFSKSGPILGRRRKKKRLTQSERVAAVTNRLTNPRNFTGAHRLSPQVFRMQRHRIANPQRETEELGAKYTDAYLNKPQATRLARKPFKASRVDRGDLRYTKEDRLRYQIDKALVPKSERLRAGKSGGRSLPPIGHAGQRRGRTRGGGGGGGGGGGDGSDGSATSSSSGSLDGDYGTGGWGRSKNDGLPAEIYDEAFLLKSRAGTRYTITKDGAIRLTIDIPHHWPRDVVEVDVPVDRSYVAISHPTVDRVLSFVLPPALRTLRIAPLQHRKVECQIVMEFLTEAMFANRSSMAERKEEQDRKRIVLASQPCSCTLRRDLVAFSIKYPTDRSGKADATYECLAQLLRRMYGAGAVVDAVLSTRSSNLEVRHPACKTVLYSRKHWRLPQDAAVGDELRVIYDVLLSHVKNVPLEDEQALERILEALALVTGQAKR